ncbi:MAG: class I SAM-dependent DNA methyltransferase [Chloroflexota bacterium]|jgi:type II restriction/modification system DNA methylase subunit YeeA
MSPMSLTAFIAKWRKSELKERQGYQAHFNDLCELLGQPKPSDVDLAGESYAFEKDVKKAGGGLGFADVWKRGYFAWEYKGKHGSLDKAYQQLLLYSGHLGNPPVLVVCDFDRFRVYTNFTGIVTKSYTFSLADLAENALLPEVNLRPLEILHAIFTNPWRLKPDRTSAQVTERAAAEFAKLAESLRRYGESPERAAHFLMRLLFCLFAQDIGLLPSGLFTQLVKSTRTKPAEFTRRLRALFDAMSTGGFFGPHDINYFNGGLFADSEVLSLASDDMDVLERACHFDWRSVEPAIFGTLFERSLDPDKRSQLGAHYTSREDILLIVEPVLMAPLRREWAEVQERARDIIAKRDASRGPARAKHEDALLKMLLAFSSRLAAVRVLDPACGSGNFLYVALKLLLDLEKEVVTFSATTTGQTFFPQVGPEQLYGIEINPYAHELAQVVVWIGYIQWLHDNGFGFPSSPILKPLDNVLQMDAILAHDEQGNPIEPEWPDADVIVGNPPFLGGKRMRNGLGDQYVDDLFKLYKGRVPHEADLVCYWFERTRALIETCKVMRAGLLATNSIRAGANRQVLDQVKATGDIFVAWSDRPWILDGAAVRVSIIGFDNGNETSRLLDGNIVLSINSNLTSNIDMTIVRKLYENTNIAYMGDTKGGAFDIPPDIALKMLCAQTNPNGRPNSDIIRPWINAYDITHRLRGMQIIDFGIDMPESDASLYELPFEYILQKVKPKRINNKRAAYRDRWWIHVEPRPAMRIALQPLSRYIATPRVAKHRLFVFVPADTLPDSRLFVFAREDEYFLGVLQSRIHERWSIRTCSWHGVGNDPTYNTSTCFETFPFPWPPGKEPIGDPRVEAVAQAARELVERRDQWLNPEGATEAALKERTLTNLYNRQPEWLKLAHRKLDEAVLDAYGWPHDLSDEEILERLLALNQERAAR